MKRTVTLLLTSTACMWAYVPQYPDGPQLHRIDYAGMQMLANQNIAPGLMTANGNVWITSDSSPITAIQNALNTWDGVSTSSARFLPLQMTTLSYNASDGNDVIVFSDDPLTEAITSGVVAFTVIAFEGCTSGSTCVINGQTISNGMITDTDILFSPQVPFSTTLAPGTIDLQAVLTHELGHAIGANHTNILSATMYYATMPQDPHNQTLSADDIAFVSSLYPASGGNGYGAITGHTLVAGAPLLGGAITAVDSFTGITVGGFSSVVDGSYSLQLPPGNYYVFVEPAANLGLYLQNKSTVLFTSFESGFAGGNAQPSVIAVQAGATASADLPAAAGLTPLKTPYTAIATAGLTGDYHGSLYSASLTVSSGQSVDLLFSNPVSGATLTESDIQIIGPVNIHSGTLRKDTITLSDGTPIYRITLDIPPLAANSSATVVFRNGTDILTRSGLLNLTRPQAVNAASFLGGPVAPGEILSFFGSQLGPATPVSNGGFDANGSLPVSLGGITISFDQTAAPLFYVSNNQVNLQVPYEISGQASTVMTLNYNATPVTISTLTVAKSAPGIFVVTNADGSVNGPGAPSPAGGILVIYGTGAGLTGGLLETGQASPANSTVAAAVTINGTAVTPVFAGLTPGSVGLTQVNVAIPAGTPPGNTVPLQFTIAGKTTQTVNISVR